MNVLIRCMNKAVNLYNSRQSKRKKLDFFKNNPDICKLLSLNKELHNAHSGKRCFVLGNGPSLREVDLSVLANEFTFTVNQIARREDFSDLHTNIHFWADPQFFNIDKNKPEDMELLEIMKKVDTSDNHPMVFFPVQYADFTCKYGLDKLLNCRYFMTEEVSGQIKNFEFDQYIPGFHTVVQYCVSLAIYMGFSEIYLLGCENTAIISNIHAELQENTEEYGYTVSENEQKRMVKAHKNVTMTDCAYSFYRTLYDYRRLNDYCENNGIKLRNCTPRSIIESIPKQDLERVLK